MAKHVIDPERLQELFNYDPGTGNLMWAIRRRPVNAGDVAGYINSGYRIVYVDGHGYGAHVIIWTLMTGAWPKNKIDHKDMNGTNNRWCNLREATHSQNKANGRAYRNNTSGYKNVYEDKRCKYRKWRAMVDKDGKHHDLGYFSSREEASAAVTKMAKTLHGEFARNNST